ncbi:hypothetical protein JCM10207_000376 [Rhodosporidiobolus poonsookiae]
MSSSSSALSRGGPEGGEPVKGIKVDERVCKDIVRFLLDPAHSTLDPASRPFYSADRLVDFAQHGGSSIAGVLVRAHEANAANEDSILRVCDSLLTLLRAPSVLCNLFGFTWTPEITKVAQVDSAEQLFRDYVDSATYAVEFDWSFQRASSTTKNSGRRESSKAGARRVELTFAHGDQGVQDLLLAHLCESMTLGLADNPFEYAELCRTTTAPEDPIKLVAVRYHLPSGFSLPCVDASTARKYDLRLGDRFLSVVVTVVLAVTSIFRFFKLDPASSTWIGALAETRVSTLDKPSTSDEASKASAIALATSAGTTSADAPPSDYPSSDFHYHPVPGSPTPSLTLSHTTASSSVLDSPEKGIALPLRPPMAAALLPSRSTSLAPLVPGISSSSDASATTPRRAFSALGHQVPTASSACAPVAEEESEPPLPEVECAASALPEVRDLASFVAVGQREVKEARRVLFQVAAEEEAGQEETRRIVTLIAQGREAEAFL